MSLCDVCFLFCQRHGYLGGGVGGFRRLLFQLRGQVRLGGIVEACRSTLGWLVRMVEGLVKQGTDGWDIVRI